MEETSLGADIATAMSGSTSTADPSATAAPPAETSAAATDTATTPPAQTSAASTTVPTDTTKQGPIPLDVHTKALDNARQKAVAEYQAKYGWAERVPETEFREAVRIAQRISADPIAHVTELIAELQAHPQHSQTLKSLAAKALSAGRGGTTTTMPEPDVTITDEHGNIVGRTYSDKGMAARDAFIVQQVLAKVDEKYAPVVKTHETLAAKQKKELDDAEGEKFATGLISEVSTYPAFKEKEKEIGAELVRIISQYPKDDPRINDPAFLDAALHRAYNRIVVPTLNTSARQSVMADLTTKAQANTVSPQSRSSAAPQSIKDMSWGDAFRAELAARR